MSQQAVSFPYRRVQVERVRVGDLKISSDYQRHKRDYWIKELTETWDEGAVGVIDVSCRANGDLYIIGGQHRWAVKRTLFGDDAEMHALVHYGMTPEEEADIYLKLARSLKQNAMDKFRAKRAKGDSSTVSIEQVLTSYGLVTGTMAPKPNAVRAITALEKINQSGGVDGLRWTLDMAIGGWGVSTAALQGDLLLGIHQVRSEDRDGVIFNERFLRALAVLPPHRLLGLARSRRVTEAGSVQTNVARILQNEYNKGLRKNRLGPQG